MESWKNGPESGRGSKVGNLPCSPRAVRSGDGPLRPCQRSCQQGVGVVVAFECFLLRVPAQLVLRLAGDEADLGDGDGAVAYLNGFEGLTAFADGGDEV